LRISGRSTFRRKALPLVFTLMLLMCMCLGATGVFAAGPAPSVIAGFTPVASDIGAAADYTVTSITTPFTTYSAESPVGSTAYFAPTNATFEIAGIAASPAVVGYQTALSGDVPSLLGSGTAPLILRSSGTIKTTPTMYEMTGYQAATVQQSTSGSLEATILGALTKATQTPISTGPKAGTTMPMLAVMFVAIAMMSSLVLFALKTKETTLVSAGIAQFGDIREGRTVFSAKMKSTFIKRAATTPLSLAGSSAGA